MSDSRLEQTQNWGFLTKSRSTYQSRPGRVGKPSAVWTKPLVLRTLRV
jgi:hypothetical protein